MEFVTGIPLTAAFDIKSSLQMGTTAASAASAVTAATGARKLQPPTQTARENAAFKNSKAPKTPDADEASVTRDEPNDAFRDLTFVNRGFSDNVDEDDYVYNPIVRSRLRDPPQHELVSPNDDTKKKKNKKKVAHARDRVGSDDKWLHTLLEEVEPPRFVKLGASAGVTGVRDWRVSLDKFTAQKRGKDAEYYKLPKRVRRYYKDQDELISAYEDLQNMEIDDEDASEEHINIGKTARLLAKITFFINLLLLIAKCIAAYLSGSLAVVSTVIDSTVDLISGALIWWSSRAMKTRNVYEYPQGRTKLEPVSIVILSVIMALASIQMVREAIEKIISYAHDDTAGPLFTTAPIIITSSTIVIKLLLFLWCRRYNSPSLQALSLDHRNDVFSNSVALFCGLIGEADSTDSMFGKIMMVLPDDQGYKLWNFADPIGAVLISVYIIVSWYFAGREQIKMLTGFTARPEFLKRLTWIALNHHRQILLIDTVRAFHFGCNFIVEVDIVLPENMTVRESHDIAESLQLKIERMPEAERCFVHIDYECSHSPWCEHKVV